MKFDMKKTVAFALAGVMTFGAASFALDSSVEAAKDAQHYEDGTTNEGSHKIKQEEIKHDKNLKEINANHRYTKDDKQYQKDLKKEQQRHDKEMQKIEKRYGTENTKK
ncbi:MAG: hypothetical protein IJ849_04090 [Selenomonadaceae bacterium]|nr:hypothetical protein [Selenomonadaceae bacterium]